MSSFNNLNWRYRILYIFVRLIDRQARHIAITGDIKGIFECSDCGRIMQKVVVEHKHDIPFWCQESISTEIVATLPCTPAIFIRPTCCDACNRTLRRLYDHLKSIIERVAEEYINIHNNIVTRCENYLLEQVQEDWVSDKQSLFRSVVVEVLREAFPNTD